MCWLRQRLENEGRRAKEMREFFPLTFSPSPPCPPSFPTAGEERGEEGWGGGRKEKHFPIFLKAHLPPSFLPSFTPFLPSFPSVSKALRGEERKEGKEGKQDSPLDTVQTDSQTEQCCCEASKVQSFGGGGRRKKHVIRGIQERRKKHWKEIFSTALLPSLEWMRKGFLFFPRYNTELH